MLPGDDHPKRMVLKELCRTRWVERHDAFEIMIDLLEPVIATLESMSTSPDEYNRDTVKDATGLLRAATQLGFIIALIIAKELLSYIKPITISLQRSHTDIVNAFGHVNAKIASLKDVRERIGTFHGTWFEKAAQLAEQLEVPVCMPRLCGLQRNRNNVPVTDPEGYYRAVITIPFVDHLVTELETRFSQHQKTVISASSLVPKILLTKDLEQHLRGCQDVFTLYRDLLPSPESLEAEIHTWLIFWKVKCLSLKDIPSSPLQALKDCDITFYPNIHILLRIFCTLPITSCECERSFSTMRRLKTYLRSTRVEMRLTNLALMYTHRAVGLNTGDIINEFTRRNQRRMELGDVLQSD